MLVGNSGLWVLAALCRHRVLLRPTCAPARSLDGTGRKVLRGSWAAVQRKERNDGEQCVRG